MIELIDVQKSFGNNNVLKNINLFIQEGEIFGIIGKSGAGKSTLLRTINMLTPPDSGEVIVDNQDLRLAKPKDLEKALHKIGMIFQHFNLLNSKTVFDNVALPLKIQKLDKTEIIAKVHDILELVGLKAKTTSYPHELSGGQKQRVAIARALSFSPKILLCDEATSALDPNTTESILDLLNDINKKLGITIVLITHEMEVVKKICHRISLIDNGEIIETSPIKRLIHQKDSKAREMLFRSLSPKLPESLVEQINNKINNRPLVKLYFESDSDTYPFISQMSRELNLDVNILQANIDQISGLTCGVLLAEINADKALLNKFKHNCEKANVGYELIGYLG